MKNLKSKIFLGIMLSLFFVSTSQGQFLKKLQKRVEQKVENAVIEKSANKVAEKATKSMDKMFDINPFGGGGKGKADPSLVADSYEFTWAYSLKMSTKDGEIIFHYFLEPGASYFAFTSPIMENILTVMDNEHQITAMFMNSQDGSKIGMVTKMADINAKEINDASEEFTFEPLPDKTINEFDCKGVKAFNDGYEMTMYYITDAEVSFNDIYKNGKTKIPDALKDYFKEDDKVLMIHMDMKNLKNKKENATMECIGLKERVTTVSKADYKFM